MIEEILIDTNSENFLNQIKNETDVNEDLVEEIALDKTIDFNETREEVDILSDSVKTNNLKFGEVLFDKKTKVYVKVNEEGFITAIGSDIFLKNLDGWIEYDEGEGDRYVHAQTSYFDCPIVDEMGNYKIKFKG